MRRKANNTLAKRKRTKRQTIVDVTLQRQLKSEQHELH